LLPERIDGTTTELKKGIIRSAASLSDSALDLFSWSGDSLRYLSTSEVCEMVSVSPRSSDRICKLLTCDHFRANKGGRLPFEAAARRRLVASA